jgi:hypothetical protein
MTFSIAQAKRTAAFNGLLGPGLAMGDNRKPFIPHPNHFQFCNEPLHRTNGARPAAGCRSYDTPLWALRLKQGFSD